MIIEFAVRALAVTTFFAVGMVLRPSSAEAILFDWSYSGLNGGPVVASGTLDASPLGGGAYSVSSISGIRNGVPLTGLTAYAAQDNLVYTTFPAVDYPGLAFTDASGHAFNVFFDTSTSDPYNCGRVGYCEIGPGTPGTTGLGPPRDSVGPIDFFDLSIASTNVPEPASWTILLVGLFALCFAANRTRRT
jgi:hypothetical protein